jgi:hypothetical protein
LVKKFCKQFFSSELQELGAQANKPGLGTPRKAEAVDVGFSSSKFFGSLDGTYYLPSQRRHILEEKCHISPYLDNEFLLVARTRQGSILEIYFSV